MYVIYVFTYEYVIFIMTMPVHDQRFCVKDLITAIFDVVFMHIDKYINNNKNVFIVSIYDVDVC